MMNELNVMELVERKFNQIDEDRKKKNEAYIKSPEWLGFVDEIKKQKPREFTVIYRDTDGALREAWHFTAEINIDYIREKYEKQKREIVRFVPKELPFGEYLKTITGSSKDSL